MNAASAAAVDEVDAFDNYVYKLVDEKSEIWKKTNVWVKCKTRSFVKMFSSNRKQQQEQKHNSLYFEPNNPNTNTNRMRAFLFGDLILVFDWCQLLRLSLSLSFTLSLSNSLVFLFFMLFCFPLFRCACVFFVFCARSSAC